MTFRERVLLGIIASGLALSMFAPSCDPKPVVSDRQTIYEDDPRWDCRTMGNKICGIDLERNR